MEPALRKFLVSLLFLVALPVLAADKSWPADEVIGKADAPMTIIEYGSLTCSHCAEIAEKVMPQLKKDWLDTGKAKLIYRDFPRDPLDQAAAMISHCAGNERYFAFVDTFFHSQNNWMRSAQPLDALKGIARLGGMSSDQVNVCLADASLLNQLEARKNEGQKLYNINATPTFVINGKPHDDMPPDYDLFVKRLK